MAPCGCRWWTRGISRIEHQFTPSTVFSIGYIGNKGYHVTPGGTNYNINQPSIVGFGTLTTNQRRYCLPVVRVDAEHQVFQRRREREVQFAAGSRREAIRERTAVTGQLHLGQRVRFLQHLFLLEPRDRLRPGKRCPAIRLQLQRLLRTAVRKEQAFPEISVARGRSVRRRMADRGAWYLGVGYSVHALLRQLRKRRGYRAVPPQSGRRRDNLESHRGRMVSDCAVRHNRRRMSGHRCGHAAAERQWLHARAVEPSGDAAHSATWRATRSSDRISSTPTRR